MAAPTPSPQVRRLPPRAQAAGFPFLYPTGMRERRPGSLDPVAPTLPPSGGSGMRLPREPPRLRAGPQGAAGRVRPAGTKATQGAAGAAPGMRGDFPPSAQRPWSVTSGRCGPHRAPGADRGETEFVWEELHLRRCLLQIALWESLQ
ncbi:collagen alpha-2(I) chain-like [Microtus oregoni]|uniref:collagen alpha-2(I) chain-like n=1 Tax=Microtus oregoni TaxID=111838 RepID=UPI001BB15EF6|nr:collagen alpha-2(I) chain-like [Microtus oregoni]